MSSPSSVNEDKSGYFSELVETKPKFQIRRERNKVFLQFADTKSSLVKIYSKRGAEESFSLLAEISGAEYIDERPNLFEAPEIREYIACFAGKENNKDNFSDIALIINK
jgi:hypothetical protein